MHAVIEHDGHGGFVSIADAARILRWSESKALREANRLVAAGLLQESRVGRTRLLHANRSSGVYPHVLRILFLKYGTTESTPDRFAYVSDDLRRAKIFPEESVLEVLPEHVWPDLAPCEYMHELTEADGLPVAEARAVAIEVMAAINPLLEIRKNLHSAWDEWRYERDQTLIHKMGHHLDGGGHRTAYHAVVQGCHRAQAAGRRCIDQRHWLLGGYAVKAQIQRLEAFSGWLATGLELAAKRQLITSQELKNPLAETEFPDRMRFRDTPVIDADLERFYAKGGTERHADIGQAGERILVHSLRRAVDHLRELPLARM
ncbi:hypothetical protein [Pseudonocardia sp. ICBG1293]|uniref:hypothetical protein n=1 Tax=Pseudonocardia sp. ICBG1293 TaxID=2844382 RepID=UPI001CCEB32A|nr:hypothetical protein [Pseudonocardia sp. ICBG1293]